MRIRRTGLTAFHDIQRNDQLITAIDRRQVVVCPGFIPGHPRTTGRALQDRRTFLEAAFEFFMQVKLDIHIIRSTDHRQQESIDPLLYHLQDRAETFSI